MSRLWRWFIGDWWVPRRSTWPYEDGYATFNPYRRTILDTGLTLEHARRNCDELNAEQKDK